MDVLRPALEPSGDHRAAIQEALDTAHDAGGGTVELPAGVAVLAAPLELRSNVTLRGSGMIATILRTGADGVALRAGSLLEGATVEELTVAGPDGAPPSAKGSVATAAVELGGGASFCFIRRVRFTDVP